MGQVSHLFLASGSHRPVHKTESALALADYGLQGCGHGRKGSRRQVLLMDSETLRVLGLEPGQIKENITTTGLRVNDLGRGQRLQLGDALLEVTGLCEPCSRMDEIRMGLQQELHGRRGILCRVVEGGRIRCGDTIQLAAAQEPPQEAGRKL